MTFQFEGAHALGSPVRISRTLDYVVSITMQRESHYWLIPPRIAARPRLLLRVSELEKGVKNT